MGKDKDKPKPKGKLTLGDVAIVILAFLAAAAAGGGVVVNNRTPDPCAPNGCKQVPRNVPTDVGTLKPTR